MPRDGRGPRISIYPKEEIDAVNEEQGSPSDLRVLGLALCGIEFSLLDQVRRSLEKAWGSGIEDKIPGSKDTLYQ